MALFLTLVSGFCWTWVYIESIRVGFKQKTYAMPLFALGLNFAWEAVHSYIGVTESETIGAQEVINVCWMVADVFIIITWLRFGLEDWPERLGKHTFYAWGALVFFVSIVLQLMFVREFGVSHGAIYAAFLQNLLMSVLFIDLLLRRDGAKGQSLAIAVNKWLGTLAPTILFGYLQHRPFVTVVGAFCSVFDLIYIGLLYKALAVAAEPQAVAASVVAAQGSGRR
jgi:hypothetical protein